MVAKNLDRRPPSRSDATTEAAAVSRPLMPVLYGGVPGWNSRPPASAPNHD
jgi:hypothetical protein